eukprot:11166060-Lingulodinium_polyedra.AAC.1
MPRRTQCTDAQSMTGNMRHTTYSIASCGENLKLLSLIVMRSVPLYSLSGHVIVHIGRKRERR